MTIPRFLLAEIKVQIPSAEEFKIHNSRIKKQ